MHVKVILYSFLIILMTLGVSSCSLTPKNKNANQFRVSLPLIETLQYALSDKPKRWQLTIGAYEVLGTVEMVTEGSNTSVTDIADKSLWRFTSDNNERVLFSEDGIHHIASLSGRDLDYQMTLLKKTKLAKAGDPDTVQYEISKHQYFRQIKIGDANYATLSCTDWQFTLFSKSQDCQSKLKHTVTVTTNSKSQPVHLEQWLPFLNQQLVLQQI